MGAGVLGKGWAFAIRPDASGGFVYEGGDEKIRQSLWLILSTAPGERVMLAQFGCGIHDLVFEPNTVGTRDLVRQRVQDALLRWEQRIDVIDVRVETPVDARNYMLIHIDYRVRSNNAFYNLVYPFFLNEGAA